MRNSITLILILTITVFSKAQKVSTCLTESQLLNLQTLSYDGVNNYLTNEGWSRNIDNVNQTNRYFGYNLEYSVAIWEKRNTGYFEGKLYLYYQTDKPNLLVYQALNECFDELRNLQPKNSQKKTQNRDYISYSSFKKDGIIIDFRNYKTDNSALRFSILIYNESSLNEQIQIVKDRIAAEIARKKAEEEARIKAESDRQRSIQSAMISGDSLLLESKFDEAITQYNLAKKYLKKAEISLLKKIESDIQNSQKNKNRVTIENSISEGDNFYNQKKFDTALLKYEYALLFYNSNPSNFDSDLIDTKIRGKITNTKATLGVIVKRGTFQSYLKENPKGFYAFRDKNYKIIETMISELKRSGNVSYKTVIKFDTLGNNESYIKINSLSRKNIVPYINRINISDLTPNRELDYFIPSIEELPFNISWNTYNLRVNSRSSKIQIVSVENVPSYFNNNIGSFINQQNFRNGIYKFEVVEKKVNDKMFSDLKLIKYRNNSGPLNSIYSLVLPGWGTSKVTDGKKGKGRLTLFLLSSALSVGSKIYSDSEYKKYRGTTNQIEAEKFYETANIANKVFLLSIGITGVIYIHDFFWVFGKGIKNNNQSKEFKSKLKNGSIKVIDSPLKPS